MTRPVNVVSFDIGIKNMAYCILSIERNINIIDWRVIDISKKDEIENEIVLEVCNCKNKTTICKKKAKYVRNDIFFCEKHARDSTKYIVPEKRLTSTNLRKSKISELEKLVEEFSIPDLSENQNKKRNKKEILEKVELFFDTKLLKKTDSVIAVKTQNINLIELARNMTKILDKSRGLNDVTHVIIENQISTLANRMKTIQGMLAQYFIMRFGDEIIIEFVSSSNKLKCFAKDNDETEVVNCYKKHKSDAVHYTKEILSKNSLMNLRSPNEGDTWTDTLVSKKKDDLCDSFLQGIWYLKKLNCIILDEYYQVSMKSGQ